MPLFGRKKTEEEKVQDEEQKRKTKEFEEFKKSGIHLVDVSGILGAAILARLVVAEEVAHKYVLLLDHSKMGMFQLNNIIQAINYLAKHGWKLVTYDILWANKVRAGFDDQMVAHAIMERIEQGVET